MCESIPMLESARAACSIVTAWEQNTNFWTEFSTNLWVRWNTAQWATIYYLLFSWAGMVSTSWLLVFKSVPLQLISRFLFASHSLRPEKWVGNESKSHTIIYVWRESNNNNNHKMWKLVQIRRARDNTNRFMCRMNAPTNKKMWIIVLLEWKTGEWTQSNYAKRLLND